jgi:hypothetical protein
MLIAAFEHRFRTYWSAACSEVMEPKLSARTRPIISKEMKMESPTHDLKGLFDQLGLDSTQKAIDDLIASHSPLPDDKKLIDA